MSRFSSVFITRKAWGARPSKSVDRTFTKTGGVVVHHSARNTAGLDHWPGCYESWRGHQRFHMDSRGWSDLAYNFGICRHGFIFEGRGWNAQNAANRPVNDETLSVCVDMNSNVQTPIFSVVESVNDVLEEAEKRGWARIVQGHDEANGPNYSTSCPGTHLRELIRSGEIGFRSAGGDTPPPPPTGTQVIGSPAATVAQAKAWLIPRALAKGSPYPIDTLETIVDWYWQVGAEYGVRPDLALAQAAKETGFFAYGGDVQSHQWNFAGIGATGGVPGLSFPTVEAGVRAHVLRMRMYAVNDPAAYSDRVLGRPLPQNHWGQYPTIEDFNGVWAVPGVGYGQSIVNDYLTPMVNTEPQNNERPLTGEEIGLLRRIIEWWRSR